VGNDATLAGNRWREEEDSRVNEDQSDVQGGAKMSWTPERVELLKELWAKGLSASNIAGRLGQGITRNAVIGKVHRLNLAGRAPQPRSEVARPRKVREPAHPGRQVAPLTLPNMGNVALKPTIRMVPVERPLAMPEPKPLRLVDAAKGDGRITILQLSDKTCKWPIGDPGDEAFCFCGHSPRDGSPYCDFHAGRAYQPLQDRRHRKVVNG
jgi:GcrA cell cycle regulator